MQKEEAGFTAEFLPETTKAVLFDMDGVLVLSEPLHYEAWFVLAREVGFPMDGFMSFEASIGISDSVVMQGLVKEHNLACPMAELLERKRAIFLELVREKGIETPAGCREFVDYCRGHCRVGLVSSSSRKSVEGVLQAVGMADRFAFLVTGDDVRQPKPSPEPYLLALQKAGVTAAAAVAIEDSQSGMTAALAAGIRVLPFKTNFYDLVRMEVGG